MSNSENISFRQILVALDDSAHSQAALESAVTFARRFDAHLTALFVEDRQLINAAKVRTFTEVNALTGEVTKVHEKYMSLQLERISTRLRRLLQFIGYQTGIEYSFKSLEGNIKETILENAQSEKVDLVALGRMSKRIGRSGEIGKTANYILENINKPILLLSREAHLSDGMTVIIDSTVPNAQLLLVAEKIAERFDSRVSIIVSSSIDENDKGLNSFVNHLERLHIPSRIYRIEYTDVYMLEMVLQRIRPGMVVANRKSPLITGGKFCRLMCGVSAPWVLTT